MRRAKRPISFVVSIPREGRVKQSFCLLPVLGIYVVSSGKTIIRVGECKSGRKRFKAGFCSPLQWMRRGKIRKNYVAYAWRENYRGKSIQIDYFQLSQRFKDDLLRRALEAELTFQFRLAFRGWPLAMSEIHFLERYRKRRAIVAELRRILAHYNVRYNQSV